MGAPQTFSSPLDGSAIQTVGVLAPRDLQRLFEAPVSLPDWPSTDIFAFTERLHAQLQGLEAQLLEATQWETGFSSLDCAEMVAGTLSYLQNFASYYAAVQTASPAPMRYDDGMARRSISLAPCPWGTIAVMLPQNAPLFLGVVCTLNALITGNRIILRAPLGSALQMALLARAIWQSKPPQGSVALVVAKGREFLEAASASAFPVLIHYLGASDFGGDILKTAFDNGKPALIDGTGNVWSYIGEGNDPAQVARLLTAGATRYNGQTCTSINGALIHPAIFDAVRDHLQAIWSGLRAGNPLQGTAIGGLFEARQAAFCAQIAGESGGEILCGGAARGNVLEPTLVGNPNLGSDIVREGVFGPVLWISSGTREDFASLWPSNRYPLCAGVLEPECDAHWWLTRLPNLARLVVGGDPSIEHIYEPWGGYPAAGANGVSFWHQKYQRIVALDTS